MARAYQHEHHDRDQLKAEIAEVQTELRRLLEGASPTSTRTRWHRRFANNLLKVWPALWTFVTVGGERFAERAQSAAATCRLQRRSLFAYLRDRLVAHNRGNPFPALT